MKKFVTLILALALCTGLAVPAFAADLSAEDAIAPLSYTITDQYGTVTDREATGCDYTVGTVTAYDLSMSAMTGYRAVAPDCQITVTNLGGVQDCYIRVFVEPYEEMSREQILAEYGDMVVDLPQDRATTYVAQSLHLTADGGWANYYEDGYANIKHIEEGETYTFSLPDAAEGKLYRVEFDVCWPDGYSLEEEVYSYYRFTNLKVDSAALGGQVQEPAEPETSGTYGPCTVTDYAGNEFSFTSAKVETGDITLDWFGDVFTAEDVTIITVQPGSTMTYSGYETGMTGYTRTGDTYAPIDAYTAWFGGTAPVDNLFGVYEEWQGNVVDMLSFYTFFDSEGDGSTDQEAYIILGDGAASEPTEPTTPAEPETPAETPEEPSVTAPNGTVTYTVQKGDTLGFIATNYYGDNAQRNALYRANADAFAATNGQLRPGMTLVIPETLGGVERLSYPVAGEGETLYTVKAGDSLSKIAQSVYGDMWRYEDIFQRNSDRLKNANTIYEGQILVLPAK